MGKTILIIDDDKDLLSLLKSRLDSAGYKTRTLADPMKAEEYIDRYNPDLLIIDIFMPERTGFNLIREFNEKGLYQDVPKIFLTCLDDDIEKITAKGCGVAQYITKPFQPEELIQCIEETLNPA
ncbi:MAG: hypothetical protein DRP85_04465 [Candidatus Makaraimicrobium thalassicum]|nr:MAG: hypothetical protein DRP85_04465 [Candidatus Omnitrophota bacterium]